MFSGICIGSWSHKTTGLERHFWSLCSPTPYSEWTHQEEVAQGDVQSGLEYL